MEQKAHQEENTKEINDLYCAIGEFVIEFEQVCFAISMNISITLLANGLENANIGHIFLAGMTASPLGEIFSSLIPEVKNLDQQEKTIVKQIFSRFQALFQKRNDIIHATWFLPLNANSMEFETANGIKFHKSKKGFEIKNLKYTVKTFKELTAEAKTLRAIFYRLGVCIYDDYDIKDNFFIDADGNVSEQF
ncbi:hypothetical protein [Calothrix sp. NIES-2098]|uniref:hypothetical protein n=1 Tax=Calothrix sp. NIES-2098 TaxID=1954171 RepID=UPI000B61B44C|nr:hypothetical protein NIES2098_72130 [Calothrix sp. NIES-2098]